jgi:hypothetical protein
LTAYVFYYININAFGVSLFEFCVSPNLSFRVPADNQTYKICGISLCYLAAALVTLILAQADFFVKWVASPMVC